MAPAGNGIRGVVAIVMGVAFLSGKSTVAPGTDKSGHGLVAAVTLGFSSLILCGALTCTYLVVHMWCKTVLA